MDWLIALGIGGLVWVALRERRMGVEEGARAAFEIEASLAPPCQSEDDRAKAGDFYWLAIRRDAFEACRCDYFTDADQMEWQRAFGEKMPSVSYAAGYLQAIKDVIAGAGEVAPRYFVSEVATELVDWIDKTQRKFVQTMVSSPYLDSYDPDGKELGRELLRQSAVRTFERVEAEGTRHRE